MPEKEEDRSRLTRSERLFTTKRLQLVPLDLELIQAAQVGREQLGRLLGIVVPREWPGEDFAEVLPALAKYLETEDSELSWNWLIVQAEERVLIGDAGFMAGPDENKVEIGYSIVPAYRNQGYATETALYLIHWALQQHGIKQVTARCLDDNLGSIKVLEKVGMRRLEPSGQFLQWETS